MEQIAMTLRSGRRKALGDISNKRAHSEATSQKAAPAKKQRVARSSSRQRGNKEDPAPEDPKVEELSSSPPQEGTETAPTSPALDEEIEIELARVEDTKSESKLFECDVRDREDPHMVTEYVGDLYQYYKATELSRAPCLYMHNQGDINARMRAILVDWLVEVHLKFKLAPPTLYLCVHLIDKYCSETQIVRSKLQLVGVTALLIACKWEEIYPPEVKDCVYITDNAYSADEVRAMEFSILRFFDFNITAPTAYHFLVRYLRIAGVSNLTSEEAHRASYYCERCLQEHEMLAYKPSMLATASVYLALRESTSTPWSEELGEASGYDLDQVLVCARRMAEHVNQNPVTASRRPLHAVKKKFESRSYHSVAESAPALF